MFWTTNNNQKCCVDVFFRMSSEILVFRFQLFWSVLLSCWKCSLLLSEEATLLHVLTFDNSGGSTMKIQFICSHYQACPMVVRHKWREQGQVPEWWDLHPLQEWVHLSCTTAAAFRTHFPWPMAFTATTITNTTPIHILSQQVQSRLLSKLYKF